MLVSLHQGLFSYCGKIRDSYSVFRGVRLLQTVTLITAGGSAAFGISLSLRVSVVFFMVSLPIYIIYN